MIFGFKSILVAMLAIYCFQMSSSTNDTEAKDRNWVPAAQKTIWQTSQTFHRILIGMTDVDFKAEGVSRGLKTLRKVSSRIAGAMGVFGAVFGIVLAFLPKQESPELKLMKEEFGKLNQKIDEVAQAIDDVKDLIKMQTHKTAYINDENKIIYGYSRMQECRQRLDSVSCFDQKDCRQKKMAVANSYIASLDVRQHIENILRGTVSNEIFGTSLLSLLQEQSKCHVPKINRYTNRLAALTMKAMSVVMFHDILAVPEYQYMEGVTLTTNMLRNLTSKRQEVENSCFNNLGYWIRQDVGNAEDDLTYDSKESNKRLLQTLTGKYPWIDWQVCTCKGDKSPVTGPKLSVYSQMFSFSKTKQVSAVAFPTSDGAVINLYSKLVSWNRLLSSIGVGSEIGEHYIKAIEDKINKSLELNGAVQAFAVLKGYNFYHGYYTYDSDNKATMQLKSVSTHFSNNRNFDFRVYHNTKFAFAVTFKTDSMECNKVCIRGTCSILPYSTKMICRCPIGFSGERCELSDQDIRHHAVISSLLSDTVKLPTFVSIQNTLEDTQLYVMVSLGSIETSISRLGSKIEEKFKNLGELMSQKFAWFSVLLKYKESIENLKYYQTLSHSHANDVGTRYLPTDEYVTYAMEEKEIARYLLSPYGIRKWLYQLNFLIIGRRGDVLNSHSPVVFMVMDRYKSRLCYPDYKAEIDRTLQQLMLLQFQGFAMWTWAYSLLNLDSKVIEIRYQKMLSEQEKFLRDNTCSAKIANSVNLHNCSGDHGFYIHPSMPVSVVCREGYYLDDKKRMWVSSVTGFSSQYSTTGNSASQVIGEPNVINGDHSKAWKPSSASQQQSLQVKFEHKVFPAEVHIHQTQNAGAVKKIEAKQPDNQWYILWEAKSVGNIQTNRPIIFSAEFNKIPFTTDELKVVFATDETRATVEIDAIQMTGRSLLKDEMVIWRTDVNKTSPGNINNVYTMDFNARLYVKSVSVIKQPNSGDVKYLALGDGNYILDENRINSTTTDQSKENLFSLVFNLLRHPSTGLVFTMPKSTGHQVLAVAVNGFRKRPDSCTKIASKKCASCGCDSQGSKFQKCDESGKCTCAQKFYGKKCSDKDCEMNEWSVWSTCPCGYHGRQKTRSRTVQSDVLGNGKRCPTNNAESTTCPMIPCHCTGNHYGNRCENRDCRLGSWSGWSGCTACPNTCYYKDCPIASSIPKGEQKVRSRSIVVRKVGNGIPCSSDTRQTTPCGGLRKALSNDAPSSSILLDAENGVHIFKKITIISS